MSELLKEYVKIIVCEGDRGGIAAQHVIAKKLKALRPNFNFVSNTKGQQTADVSIFKGKTPVGAIESKSIEGGSGLTALFDNTVSLTGETIFDGLASALAVESDLDIEDTETSIIQTFIEGIGGSAGVARPVPKNLLKNMSNPDYEGYSHKLLKRDGKQHVFRSEVGDTESPVVFKMSSDGTIKAFMTVAKMGKNLVTSSSPRPWASSGTIPVNGGIGSSQEVKNAAYMLMKDHFKEGGDDYFVLVDGDTIYPFIVPGSSDPLNLKELKYPVLSPSSFTRAGLSTYGNAGVGKIRLALKASFSTKKPL